MESTTNFISDLASNADNVIIINLASVCLFIIGLLVMWTKGSSRNTRKRDKHMANRLSAPGELAIQLAESATSAIINQQSLLEAPKHDIVDVTKEDGLVSEQAVVEEEETAAAITHDDPGTTSMLINENSLAPIEEILVRLAKMEHQRVSAAVESELRQGAERLAEAERKKVETATALELLGLAKPIDMDEGFRANRSYYAAEVLAQFLKNKSVFDEKRLAKKLQEAETKVAEAQKLLDDRVHEMEEAATGTQKKEERKTEAEAETAITRDDDDDEEDNEDGSSISQGWHFPSIYEMAPRLLPSSSLSSSPPSSSSPRSASQQWEMVENEEERDGAGRGPRVTTSFPPSVLSSSRSAY